MPVRSRMLSSVAVAVLAASGLTVTTSGSATAAPSSALACLDHTHPYNSGASVIWPDGSTDAVATSYCNDINVKPNVTVQLRTCWIPSSGAPGTCNTWRTITGGTWGLAATDVLDGTKFYLQFAVANSAGTAAY